ncbi:SAM-dependent methyltransferase [Sphingobacteriaceae bacterium]|nr:SAM-dependent methyltransferase [Sphingobacteriaceae bacterium]
MKDVNANDVNNRYKETFETWDKLASLYQEKFMRLDFYDETYDKFLLLISQKNARILEIGCGPGNITKYLLNKRPDLKIKGTDVSPAMIRLAQENNPGASFRVLDCRNLKELKTKVDAIVCGFCIPYLSPEDCSMFIKDCSDLMNDWAVLYLSFVEGDSSLSGFQTGSTGDRTYFYYHSQNNLREYFMRHKFELIDKYIVNYKRSHEQVEKHTVLLFKKN